MLNQRTMLRAKAVGDVYPGDAGLTEAIEKFLDFTNTIPDHYEFDFHLNFKPEALGKEPNEVFANMLMNLKGWVGYFLMSSVYNLRHLIDVYCEGLNSYNYYASISSTRSIIERLAVINYHCGTISKSYDEVKNASINDDQSNLILSLVKCISTVADYAKLTRWNWPSYMKQDWDTFFSSWDKVDQSINQKNILTLIDKLPQEEKGVRFRYDLLCEYVHPNAGSHMLAISSTCPGLDGTMRYILDFKPSNNESIDIVIHTTSSSITHSLRLIENSLTWLNSLHNQITEWESFTRKVICEMGGA